MFAGFRGQRLLWPLTGLAVSGSYYVHPTGNAMRREATKMTSGLIQRVKQLQKEQRAKT